MPRQSPASQGQDVDPLLLVHQTLQVPEQGSRVRHDPMGEADGLGGLQVSEAGHQEGKVLPGKAGHGVEELDEEGSETPGLLPEVEAHVCGDLVIAAASWREEGREEAGNYGLGRACDRAILDDSRGALGEREGGE